LKNASYLCRLSPAFGAFLLLAFFFGGTMPAQAKTGCTLVISAPDGTVLKEDGDCTKRHTPASSFKIPLALMGFDAGVLKDQDTPRLPYDDAIHADIALHRQTTTPTLWLQNSVVWFSQRLTETLGMMRFQTYVDRFEYGNRDLSGSPGKANGLTQAWLTSSLQISPAEQAVFIAKFLRCDLGVTQDACRKTRAIIPRFPAADGWTIYGKTGSGWMSGTDGIPDRQKPLGWFVGWAERGDRTVIFVKLILEENDANGPYGGPIAKDEFLKEFKDHIAPLIHT
jgi:beta-lactamase class D